MNVGAALAGDDARSRLLRAALRLFAEQGYKQTSTRELAEAAKVNVASISYYFGDKAGLYRAAFFEPLGEPGDEAVRLERAACDLPTLLRTFYVIFLDPLRNGEAAQLCIKLRFREILEPTGLWDEEVNKGIKPMHDTLVALLARAFGLHEPDLELHRLVTSLAGLGVQVHVCREVTDRIAPGLNDQPDSVDLWISHLTGYALAMVQGEADRRGLKLKGAAL